MSTSICAKSVSDGALAQLGAVGGEEKYTTCEPSHTFFSQSYRRHTPFAIGQLDYSFEQNASTLSTWSTGKCLSAKLPRHGDLLIGSYVRAILGRLYINDTDNIVRTSNADPAIFDGQEGVSPIAPFEADLLRMQNPFSTVTNFYTGYFIEITDQGSGTVTTGIYGPITSYNGAGLIGVDFGGNTVAADTVYNIIDPAQGDPFLYAGDEDLQLHWCNEVGFALVQQAVWKVGQNPIDSVTSEVMHCYHEKCTDDSRLLRDAVGRLESSIDLQTFSAANRQLYVPLPYCYSQSARDALPVVALAHDRIEHEITLRGRDELIVAFDTSAGIIGGGAVQIPSASISGGGLSDLGMMAEFVFLDKPEQRAYCEHPITRYFEFTQGSGGVPNVSSVSAGATTKVLSTLNLNHSITSLWAFYRADAQIGVGTSELEYFNFSTELSDNLRPQRTTNENGSVDGLNRLENPFNCIDFSVNSSARISRPGVYWQELGAYQKRVARRSDSYIMVYSFALNDSCSEPSGALNVGRFANTPMTFHLTKSNASATGIAEAGKIFVFARTQGVYKIAGGKMGLAWSTV